jgi:hypothetical protein
MQIGDLDRLWNETIGNANSRFEVIGYNYGGADLRSLTNYFICSGRSNPFFEPCHWLFVAVWHENGGRTSTEGMHASPLLTGLHFMGHNLQSTAIEQKLTDCHTHEQVVTSVMGLIDEEVAGIDRSTLLNKRMGSSIWNIPSSSTNLPIRMGAEHLT